MQSQIAHEFMIRIATRGSELALWQAKYVQKELLSLGHESELIIIKTKGDEIQHLSFDKIEGKGFFTKEIEDALLANEADIAVHSLKDLPTTSPEGLVIAGLSSRANPADLLISNKQIADPKRPLKLRLGARVGTSSVRRKSQLLHFDDQLKIVDIRGNVPTRIDKLRNGVVDAIVIAAAGVERLEINLSEFDVFQFHPEEFIPAPAQGIIAYQCGENAKEIRRIVKNIHYTEVAQCSNIERSILNKLDGGCQLPLGVYCFKDKSGNYHCSAALYREKLKKIKLVRKSQSSAIGLAEAILNELLED